MSKNLPIGFFDYGVGGLSVYAAFRKLMPNENTIYYDGCLKIEENTGYQMLVPIEDGKLNLVADRYYVDTNNKLKVKII